MAGYGMGMNGGQSQMMSMSMSSLCLVSVVALGGAALLMMNNNKEKPKETDAPVMTPVGTTGPETGGALGAGWYNIKYGGVGMSVNPKSCGSTQVGFNNTTENDQQVWSLQPVPGRTGLYYVSSEHKQFDSGCNVKYLTAPTNCDGTPELNKPEFADLQYWSLVPRGDGKFMLRNQSCADKRQSSYLSSSGVAGDMAKSTMTSREGSPYSINPWTSA